MMTQATVTPNIDVHSVPSGMRVAPLEGSTLPLVIQPEGDRSEQTLLAWLRENRAWIRAAMTHWGALLVRGFDVPSAAAFERAILAVDDELQTFYCGTSPRLRLTDYVFTASELPWYYPIPQHCEMSFIAKPPRRIYFFGMVPAKTWGETPLVDFRSVARDLDPAVKAQFKEKGIRNVRNYFGPVGGNRFDLTDYKRWDDMFKTTIHAEVDRLAATQGFETQWKPGDRLALINRQPAFITHPDTGEEVWFNHAQVFHSSTAFQEMERTAAALHHPLITGLQALARGMVWLNRAKTAREDLATEVTYGDGTLIPDAVMSIVRDAIWKNMVVTPWKRGDVVLLDNWLVSHGRRPYRGDREVAVTWSA